MKPLPTILLGATCFAAGVVAGVVVPWRRCNDPSAPERQVVPPEPAISASTVELPIEPDLKSDRRTRGAYLTALGILDPLSALGDAQSLPLDEALRVRNQILAEWLRSSPDVACAYVFSNAKDFILTKTFRDTLIQSRRFDLCVSATDHIHEPRDRVEYLTGTAALWPPDSLNAFEPFLAKAHDDSVASNMLGLLAERNISDAPESTMQFLEAHLGSESVRREVYAGIVSGYIKSNRPGEAQDWLESLPQGPDLDDAYCALAMYIAGYDPEAAIHLIAKNPTSRLVNVALSTALERAERRTPGISLQTILQVPTYLKGEHRSKRISESFTSWYSKEPQAAVEFVRASRDLNEGQKAELLRLVATGP